MMIVVQRRSDGLFYVNGSKRYGHSAEWTSNLHDVKPFRGIAGVRSAFAPGSFYWGRGWSGRPSTYVDKCCEETKWRQTGYVHQCKHYKAKRAEKIAKFRQTYRLFEVEIRPIREVPYE